MEALRSVADGMRQAASVLDTFAGTVQRMHFGQAVQLPHGFALPSPVAQHAPRGGDEHAGPTKRKRAVKVKDPNAPKRPASSYLLFQNAVRQETKKENPTLPNNELLALISQRWANMSDSEKQVRRFSRADLLFVVTYCCAKDLRGRYESRQGEVCGSESRLRCRQAC
jgi:hypothetical protein